MGLFSLYQYLELTTDGPRFELSQLAGMIDWQGIMQMAPSRSVRGMIYYIWSSLIHGVENTIALFPAVDIKPKVSELWWRGEEEIAGRHWLIIGDQMLLYVLGCGWQLIRLGLLEKLEDSFESKDITVRLCAAYVVSRLSKNMQVARMVAARPKIMKGILDLINKYVPTTDT